MTTALAAGCIALVGTVLPAVAAVDDNAAVALIYHRFGEDDYPATNVRMEQLEAHVEELASDRYTVMTLGAVTEAIAAGRTLPPRTVAISVDDAYLSVYEKAWPLFKKHGLSFTLFVATDPVDRGIPGYMDWDQIRHLHDAGVEIGSQAVNHPHMPGLSETRARHELAGSADRIEAEIGERPTLFAYPYGEASNALKRLAEDTGYRAAFGQHSGGLSVYSDRYYMPRFPVNENFGGIDRFKRIVNSLPLPVKDLTPTEPFLGAEGANNPPAFGFTLAEEIASPSNLACYHSDTGKIDSIDRLGPRIEVRFDRPFAAGRTRINCTVPTPSGRWRWFGMQYYVKP